MVKKFENQTGDVSTMTDGNRSAAEPPVRIAVTVPMVWSVRNVLFSRVLDELRGAGLAVDVIIRHMPPQRSTTAARLRSLGAGVLPLIVPNKQVVRGRAAVDRIVTGAFARRNRVRTYRILQRWFARHQGLRMRIREHAVESVAWVAQWKPIFDVAVRVQERAMRKSMELDKVRAQLQQLAPDILWVTVCVTPLEVPYILAARDLGIPIVASILSFDNLTSRGKLPTFDYYLLWNRAMLDELRTLYPEVDPARIAVTGTPQFDFHRQEAYRWSREATLSALGLPPETRYFLYAAGSASLAPAEPELVAGILERMQGDKTLHHHRMVLRLHPLDSRDRWASVLRAHPGVVLSLPWDTGVDAEGWAWSSPEDQARLVSSLAHADACINVGSTIALDAAILDRPVIAVDFSNEPQGPHDLIYGVYSTTHYAPLVESGGMRMAGDWEELMRALREVIAEPHRDAEQRRNMVEVGAGQVDGYAGERVARALLQWIQQKRALEAGIPVPHRMPAA